MKILQQRFSAFVLSFILVLPGLTVSSYSQDSHLSRYQKAKLDANRHTVTVMGGGISGTYIRFATDLANVLNEREQKNSLRVLPIIGFGGGYNLKDIMFLRGIDMGITQAEHLEYWKKRDPVLFRNIESKIRYIAKLYNAEWHVVAKKNIRSLEDLRGKTVNLWAPASATGIAGHTIFDTLGIQVNAIYVDSQLGLEKVRSGEIAATTLLAGAPITKYSTLTAGEDLHFVPVNNPALLQSFLPSRLKHSQYPNLIPEGQSVPTVASSVMLAVYNWPEGSQRYKKLEAFVQKFFLSIEKFRGPARHPKWKTINLSAKVPGWKRFKPATRLLSKLSDFANRPPSYEDFSSFMKKNQANYGFSSLTERERQRYYKRFLDWMKANP